MSLCSLLKTLRPLLKALLLSWVLLGLAAQAATGPEVAQLLNTRYRNTVVDCPGNHAAYFCSGVLVSGLASGFAIKFWEHSDNAIIVGARSFSYLRSDLGIRSLRQPSGMVFSDMFTAISQGKAVDVLCAYPLATGIQGLYGCGVGGTEEDPASCAALGVTDASGWLMHFQQQGQDPMRQCSLSSRIPAQFRASLLAHEQLGGDWVAQPNQLPVRNWNAQAPAQLPVQALFYDVAQHGGQRVAQRNQRDYYSATGQWLPILRLNMAASDGAVFGFDLQDQLYNGYQVAERLNARYFNTAITCPDGRASFYCNGVIVRGTDATSAYHSWNPSHYSVDNNGVSVTFVRADSLVPRPVWPQGFLFKESAAPAAYPLTLRCEYPYDGHTGLMPDPCAGYGRCADLGVNDVATWMQRYQALQYESCSFAPTADKVQVLLDVRKTAVMPPFDWNEFILTTWPQNIPEQLPVDAVFYSHEAYYPSDGLGGARYIQDDYFRERGRFWPIVQMHLGATDGQVFTFTPDDQCLTDTCSPPAQALGVQDMRSWFREHGQ